VTDDPPGREAGQLRVRVRLFAIQRELAGTRGVEVALPDGATIEDAWAALVNRFPVLAPGRASLRFARNGGYAPPDTPLGDGDEVAMIPPVSGGIGESRGTSESSGSPVGESGGTGESGGIGESGGSGGSGGTTESGTTVGGDATLEPPGRVRILELREAPFDASILAELSGRLATPEDGAVVGFLGVTRRSPGTPAPGQEAEAARHAARIVEALTYEAHPEMALRVLVEIADEIEARFGVTRLAIVHREGEVPLGEPSVAIVACAPHRDAAFEAARYAIDETKSRAPIWKAEQFEGGRVWIGEPARTGPAEG
jgi:molybdopterin synthase catalytic subunit/molybdopterin converting factor small subunit